MTKLAPIRNCSDAALGLPQSWAVFARQIAPGGVATSWLCMRRSPRNLLPVANGWHGSSLAVQP